MDQRGTARRGTARRGTARWTGARWAVAGVALAASLAATSCAASSGSGPPGTVTGGAGGASHSAGTAGAPDASAPAESSAPRPPADAFRATVVRVVDGDTLRATVAGRGEVKVRLIGVDAPETVDPGRPDGCYGVEASAGLRRLVSGSDVVAAFQPQRRTDRYGRDLWDVWLPDGRFLQAVLVADGLAVARAYPPTTDHAAYLDTVMADARARRAGLWGACSVVPRTS